MEGGGGGLQCYKDLYYGGVSEGCVTGQHAHDTLKTLSQCRFNVGPASAALTQQST